MTQRLLISVQTVLCQLFNTVQHIFKCYFVYNDILATNYTHLIIEKSKSVFSSVWFMGDAEKG